MEFLLIVSDIDINQSILNIVDVLALLSGGFCAVGLLRAGWNMLLLGDDYNAGSRARTMIMYCVVGLVLALGAVTLAHLFVGQIVHTK